MLLKNSFSESWLAYPNCAIFVVLDDKYSKEVVQLAEVFHLKFLGQCCFYFLDFLGGFSCNNEVIDVDSND